MWSLLDSANNSGVPLEELLDEVNQVNDIPGINPVNRASSLENAPALQKWVGRGYFGQRGFWLSMQRDFCRGRKQVWLYGK